MEVETMSKVSSNYGATEAVKVSAPKSVDKAEVVFKEPLRTDSAAAALQSVDAKGNAEQQGSGQQKGHKPSEATVDDAVKREIGRAHV